MPRIRRALISVYDKTGIADFARELCDLNVEIVSTGGTAKHLEANGVHSTSISDVTSFPEILGGRVKTLHPKIFGGLLAVRDDATHAKELAENKIVLFDLIVVNLYPFEATIAREDVSLRQALENIDIGGPCLLRAAAKNFIHVAAVTSPRQYRGILDELQENGSELTIETRKTLSVSAFKTTMAYDRAIQSYLSGERNDTDNFPATIHLGLEKVEDLRYGENPHQKAALYRIAGEKPSGLLEAKQLHGKELSYNNLLDANTALGILREFETPCVAIVKHNNPCGVAMGQSLAAAYENARATDPVSAFGSIVGLNRSVDIEAARAISNIFTEVVLAPGYDSEALGLLARKKNLRLLELASMVPPNRIEAQITCIQGGVLLQDQDFVEENDINLKVVSIRQPSPEELIALKFGWRICKWVKSNAIIYCRADRTIGIGAGQMSRVDSSRIAADKARKMGLDLVGTVLASDAFFPFRDGVDIAAEVGATAIIQPGGSIRDEEVIQAADEHGLAMVFSGVRHFRH